MLDESKRHAMPASRRRLAEALARVVMNQSAQLPTAINAAVVRNPELPRRLRGVPQRRPDGPIRPSPYNSSLLSPHRLTDVLVPLTPPSPKTMEGIFALPITPPSPKTIEDILALPKAPTFGNEPYYQPRFIDPMYPDEYDAVPDDKNIPQDDPDPLGIDRRQMEQPWLKRIENVQPHLEQRVQIDPAILNALLK
jgi:hypothetical protein